MVRRTCAAAAPGNCSASPRRSPTDPSANRTSTRAVDDEQQFLAVVLGPDIVREIRLRVDQEPSRPGALPRGERFEAVAAPLPRAAGSAGARRSCARDTWIAAASTALPKSWATGTPRARRD